MQVKNLFALRKPHGVRKPLEMGDFSSIAGIFI